MFKTSLTKTLLVVSLMLGATSTAFAAEPTTKHRKHNVVHQETSRTKTDSGYISTSSKTDAKGATATHRTEVVNNKADGSRTRTVSGSTFEGKSYSGQTVSRKTDKGYTSQGQMTNSDGKVVDRFVDATIDKDANTVTKNISVTPQGGETKTHTVVHSLKKSR